MAAGIVVHGTFLFFSERHSRWMKSLISEAQGRYREDFHSPSCQSCLAYKERRALGARAYDV
jgi:hypothetical protein